MCPPEVHQEWWRLPERTWKQTLEYYAEERLWDAKYIAMCFHLLQVAVHAHSHLVYWWHDTLFWMDLCGSYLTGPSSNEGRKELTAATNTRKPWNNRIVPHLVKIHMWIILPESWLKLIQACSSNLSCKSWQKCSQEAEGSKCPRQFDNSQEAQDDQVDPTSTINQFLEDDHVNNANHLGLAEAKNSWRSLRAWPFFSATHWDAPQMGDFWASHHQQCVKDVQVALEILQPVDHHTRLGRRDAPAKHPTMLGKLVWITWKTKIS